MKTSTRTLMTKILATNVLTFAAIITAPTWAEATQQPTTLPGNDRSSTKSAYRFEVSGSKQWIDTNIDLRSGEKLQITAAGTIIYAKGNQFGPEGLPRSYADLIHQYPVPNGGHGELIGRLGSLDVAEGFEIGANVTYTAPVAGRLFLGINQSMKD